MHRKEGERCASGRRAPPPPSPFLLREHVRGRIYGRRWRVARPNDALPRVPGVHRAKCIRAAYRTAPAAGGPCYPFSPPWCMYTYRATCVDLIRREVQRPCYVNEKSAVVRTRAKLCGNASGAHVLSVIILTTGICSNDSFESVKCNSGINEWYICHRGVKKYAIN